MDEAAKERSSSKKKLKSEGEIRLWAELETDLLLTIYRKMDVKNLVIGAPLCCASWYKASKDPSLWKDVDCRFFDYGVRHKQVQPLDLVDFVITRSQGLLNSIKFPSYRVSSVKELLYVAESHMAAHNLISPEERGKTTKLSSLMECGRNRGRVSFSSEELSCDISWWRKKIWCPRLKNFELFMPYNKIYRGKESIHWALSKLKELESMQVQDYFLSDEAILNQIAQYCPKLRKLKISTTVSEKTAALISKSLPKLKVIDLSNTRTQRDALLVILNDCKELESLDVSRCDTVIEGDAEIQKLAHRLEEFKWDNTSKDDDPWDLNYLGASTPDSNSDSDSECETSPNRHGA